MQAFGKHLKHFTIDLAPTLLWKGLEDIENDESVGFELISTDDIDDLGIPAIITQIRQRVGTNPVYLRYCVQHFVQRFNENCYSEYSLDIDVIGAILSFFEFLECI